MANKPSWLAAVGLTLGVGAALPGQAVPIDPGVLHALNRITFGATLPQLIQLSQTPTNPPSLLDRFVNQQTAPLTVPDDPRVAALLAQLPSPRTDIEQVKQEQFIRACFSTRQLQEVMTQFWQRHFSTNFLQVRAVASALAPAIGASEAVLMIDETNQDYRQHALGTFEDLLVATLKSRAMNCYLSQFNSRSGPGPNVVPNEDYSRETLELHSLGATDVNQSNYSQADIEALAECIAGWTVWRPAVSGVVVDPFTGAVIPSPQPLQLVFAQDWHEAGLSLTLDFDPADPTDDLAVTTTDASGAAALTVFAHLARMQRTKVFVCSKLIDFFLADGASVAEPALLAQCVTAWGPNGGDIAAVLQVILKSPVFQGPTYRWQRLRMPMEWTCWVTRSLDGTAVAPTNLQGAIAATDRMGQELFQYPSPDGYPTQSVRQPGTQIYIDAIRHAHMFLRSTPPTTPPEVMIHDIPGMITGGIGLLIPGGSATDANDVANYLLRRLYVDRYTPDDLARLEEFLELTIFGLPPAFASAPPADAAQRMNLLAALAVVLPQGLKK